MGFPVNTPHSDYSIEFITVKTASEISGYNQQYLRRLLREGTLLSKRIGQLWLIDRDDFKIYLQEARKSEDNRFGPQDKTIIATDS